MIAFLLCLPRQLSNLEARFDALANRLRIQEKNMSKLAPILAALAISVPALAASQKQEADDAKKLTDTLDAFLASKTDGDPITGDEIAQLQGFSDAIKTAADNSTARATDLEKLVAEIPSAPADPQPTDAPVSTTVGDATATPVSTPVADPVGTPVATAPTTTDADTGAPDIAA